MLALNRLIFILFFLSLNFAFGVSLKSLFDYSFDADKVYDTQRAKELYFKKRCNTCHGDMGEKKLTGSRRLRDMNAQDIKSSLIDYALGNNSQTAGSVQMAIYANSLTHDEMDELIAYIKGENFVIELQIQDLIEQEPPKKTKHGTFIK
ncbi:c-type cytochrome [Campylobacter sp. LR291e]|uniref:c-type cytochrome n=1 Tax=unclassified Campylobacter TaxID=2593542 RepID=UPI001237D0B9|nr:MULTISPECIES: c-type cytochrome [unclassified Campylobacter]KAA6225391.1 c-type cytochrome [Campylobacter sp. LR185c]KAA6230767.1 c-type cytochrome [Campylobacter sp. LR291e]KAA8604918.1 cytochrome C [Campylobacter sp. LR185c]